MNKRYIVIICGVVLLICGVLMKFTSYSYDDAYQDASSIENYEFECDMEVLEDDELKKYHVVSSYALLDNQEYYKVELVDKSINMSQVILRNKEGVFVVTPSLNQAFQFQSDWPNNSLKPYIYQSLLSFMKDNKREKVKEGYCISGEIQYENDNRIAYQEVIVDKKLYPVSVSLYDQEQKEVIKLTMTSFKINVEYKEKDFKADELIDKNTAGYSEVSSLPVYPVALMGSVLADEEVSSIDSVDNHILRFTGEKNYTIIQSPLSANETLEVTKVEGELIDMIDYFGYQDQSCVTVLSSGIMCSIYSNDLTYEEKLSVLSSMQLSQVK